VSPSDDLRNPAPVSGNYYRVVTADGVEFRLDPGAVRFARRWMMVGTPVVALLVSCPVLLFVGGVGYLLAGMRWWGALPGVATTAVLALTVSRWAMRWAHREGAKVLVVEPGGRIVLDGNTLVRRERVTGVRVERVEGWDDGPVVNFQVILDTADGPVQLPVPEYGQWNVRAQYWYDWQLGFGSQEEAERFAGEVADALRPAQQTDAPPKTPAP
jgi:hypothetical protein